MTDSLSREQAIADYAAACGRGVDSLSDAEKRQAFMAALMEYLEPYTIEQRTIWRFRITWILWRLWVRIRYALTGNCGCVCGCAEPYGFVPEAGCPIHDRSADA